MEIDQTHNKGNDVSVKTNIDLDERLVKRAQQMTGLKTKKELVNHALSELVRRQDQKAILRLRGKISWVGDLEASRESRF
jgi:Arc/MetJ family transcription regulator